MSNKNVHNNKPKTQELKFHNPKAHTPAVYIPCWLIQIPVSQLSYQGKLLYGRLAQWSNVKGIVYRSIPQLGQELGCCLSTIKRTLKELRDVGLIDTYQAEAGGINHYRFLDHPWMHESINKNLEYQSYPQSPKDPQSRCDPTPSPDVTLPQPTCDPTYKIKENNINKKSKRSACFTNKSVDNFLKPKPKLKYLTQEERLENEKHIRAREEKARMEKEEEIKPFRRNGEITVLGNLFKGF